MSFGKMNGFADIVETRQVKDSEGFTHSEDEVLATEKVGMALSAGRTSPHSAKRPTCSAFGVFLG